VEFASLSVFQPNMCKWFLNLVHIYNLLLTLDGHVKIWRPKRQIEWWCQNFHQKHINSRFSACAVKIRLKLPKMLPKFQFHIKSTSWRDDVTGFQTGSRNKPFLSMCIKQWSKRRKCFLMDKISHSFRKSGLWIARWCQIFDCMLPNSRFCACAFKSSALLANRHN